MQGLPTTGHTATQHGERISVDSRIAMTYTTEVDILGYTSDGLRKLHQNELANTFDRVVREIAHLPIQQHYESLAIQAADDVDITG